MALAEVALRRQGPVGAQQLSGRVVEAGIGPANYSAAQPTLSHTCRGNAGTCARGGAFVPAAGLARPCLETPCFRSGLRHPDSLARRVRRPVVGNARRHQDRSVTEASATANSGH